MTEDQLRAIEARAKSYGAFYVARTDIPALVAEVRRLRKQVDALESALRESIEALEDSHYLVAGEFPNTPSEHPKVPRLTAILNGESEGANGN